jgi:hypothetical protein
MKRLVLQLVSGTQRAQVLVLGALLMVILIGITGLAIDVSAAYMADRWQRSVADAASLAGGQDLQIPGSQLPPPPAQYQRAREHAMQVLVSELRSTGNSTALAATAACLSAAGCPLPGTPYVVSVRTNPSPSGIDCDKATTCIQVSIRQPSFGLTFGRIFGQTSWKVSSTSVAGIVRARQYGVVTLRPTDPRTNGTDANEKDLFITGGSQVIVKNADVGVNTNLIYSGTNSALVLDAGFNLYYHDTYKGWVGNPTGVSNSSLILDPNYPIPTPTCGGPCTYDNEAQAMDTTAGSCAAQQASVPSTYKELKSPQALINDPSKITAKCFKPGIYRFTLENNTNHVAYLLEPGVFYFNAGLNIGSTVIGGYVPDQSGVALVFDEAHNPNATPGQMTTSNSTSLVALNFGSAYLNPGGIKAKAANGPQGPVQTPGNPGVLMSILVRPDRNCQVVDPEPPGCIDNQNNTLKLTGGGNIFLAGIQYAPSDNAEMKGNTGQTAEVGQLITWTLKFDSSVFNITAVLAQANGVLRLDRACSPTEPCTP